MRDPKYDILFEPVPIGPLMAKNRFFQVPHCNGMGYRDPVACAEMRAVKAQGGWAVVCTEEAEIHYTSEVTPYVEARIWDDSDIPALARMTERVHDCGAVACIELAYNGLDGSNLHSRVIPQAPSALPVISGSTHPVQARARSPEPCGKAAVTPRNSKPPPTTPTSPPTAAKSPPSRHRPAASRFSPRSLDASATIRDETSGHANRPAASAQRGDGCVVVGLGGDLRHQQGMQHGAV